MDKLFCTYHNTSAPIDDFCCPWNIQNVALHFQDRAQELTKQLAELREKMRWIPFSEKVPPKEGWYEIKFGDEGWIEVKYFFTGNADSWKKNLDYWREIPELGDGE